MYTLSVCWESGDIYRTAAALKRDERGCACVCAGLRQHLTEHDYLTNWD